MGITLENNDFSKNSETLLKDIEQTQKKKENKDTLNLFSSQLVLKEIQDLNEQRQAIQYYHKMTPIFDEYDDPQYQSALQQNKDKFWQ